MSRPRSSRRTSARIATFHVDDEVEISSSLLQNDSLHDGASGAGPPVSSLQSDTDLTEVPGSVVHNEYMNPSFDDNAFAFAKIDENTMAPCDRWAQRLIGKRFRYKDEELEDDLQFKAAHPTNVFVIFSIVVYSAEKRQFLQANVRYAKKNLHFICYSLDAMDDYELIPVKSFYSRVQERNRFYQMLPLEAQFGQSFNLHMNETQEDNYDSSTDYMQGVTDSHKIFNLTPLQIGVFLTFLPPTRGYILSQRNLYKFRRAFGIIIKKLISDGLNDDEKNGWTNVLMVLPYMFLQYNKNKPDEERCNSFYSILLSGDVLSIKVGDFKKKTMKVKNALSKRFDFQSRCHRQADINVRNGDYAKAMESLLRINSKVNFSTIENVINDSLPSRNYSELSVDQRQELFTYVDSSSDDFRLTTNDVLHQLKKMKKN